MCSNLSPWLSKCAVGDIHTVAISHGEGRFVCPPELLAQLRANGQLATQYVDLDGEPSMDLRYDPNGSVLAVEGITSADGRVFGKMGPLRALRPRPLCQRARGQAPAHFRGRR